MSAFLWAVLIPALLPVFFIFLYIYRADKNEREPIRFVLKVMLMGAIFALPCAFIESAMESLLQGFYDPESIEYGFMENTVGVALIEELSKWLVFMFFVWKSKDFDHTFDGIVYGASASLGFAAIENVMYVIDYGTGVSITRAIFSIPGHTTFGLFMGYYMSRAKMRSVNKKIIGLAKLKALLVPTLLHGIYDFLLSDQAGNLTYLFIFYVIFLDVISWKLIKKQSKKDESFYRGENRRNPFGKSQNQDVLESDDTPDFEDDSDNNSDYDSDDDSNDFSE